MRRRAFLKSGGALAGAGALPFLFSGRSLASDAPALIADPNGILDLPPGFSYRILERQGDAMSDGYRVPALPDGMGCFPRADGSLVLMRNHELSGRSASGPYFEGQVPNACAYDAASDGGVTRLVLGGSDFTRVSSNLVLTGTVRNCSGGLSPWGWLSCEESFDATHGYVFLCSTEAESVQPFRRITGYGHFYHEAATVDPRDGAAYLTEDRADGCFYRFMPDDLDDPFVGRLQAMGIAQRPTFSTATGLVVGSTLEVCWLDLAEPNPPGDSLRSTAYAAGAAIVRRGEGVWYSDGVVYITATSGGAAGVGQVFALTPTANGGSLTLLAESRGQGMLDGPDGVVVAPWGGLLLCEDSVTGSFVNHLRGLTSDGTLYALGRTSLGEFGGVCCSPDGRAVFVNIYGAGFTVVITGPFGSLVPGNDGGAGAGVAQGGGAGAASGEAANGGGAGRPTSPDGGHTTGPDDSAGSPGEPAGENEATNTPFEVFEPSGACACDVTPGSSPSAAPLAVTLAAAALVLRREER